MKKFLLAILFLIAFGLGGKVYAQAPSLGFDTTLGLPNFPDTAVLGDVVSFNLKVKNYGNAPFSGIVSIERQIKDSTGNIVDSASITISQQASIGLGTVFNLLYVDTFSAARQYFVGIDVVVIWPKAIGATTHDSLSFIVHILNPNSVSRLLAENGILVYPVPCNSILTIENKYPSNPIEQVSIYDLKGKLILSKTREETIDLSSIPNALYIIELNYKSGMRKWIKVQKQE